MPYYSIVFSRDRIRDVENTPVNFIYIKKDNQETLDKLLHYLTTKHIEFVE